METGKGHRQYYLEGRREERKEAGMYCWKHLVHSKLSSCTTCWVVWTNGIFVEVKPMQWA